MATAAVIDAARKDERRQSLEHKIEVTKQNLFRLMREGKSISDYGEEDKFLYPEPFQDLTKTCLEVLERMCIRFAKPQQLLKHEEKLKARQNELRELRYSLSVPWATTPEPIGTTTLRMVTEALLDEEAEAKGAITANREPYTETHMDRMNLMVNCLVDNLLATAYRISEAEFPGTNPPPESLDSADTLIRLLRSDGYPRYTFPDLKPEEAVNTRCQMDDLNKKIMVEFQRPYRVRAVAKICYNLLVCDFPPSIQNYNTLIWGFTELGEQDLAWVVVESFLHHSHLKPTQGTMICLLQHFRLKRDVVGFFDIIRRMIGMDPRGIGLMRKKIDDTQGVRALFLRAGGSLEDIAIVNNEFFIQRAKLDRYVLESIVEGLIDFGIIQYAASLIIASLHKGWVVNTDMLNRFLHACIDLLDHSAATTVVQGFLSHIDQATSLVDQTSVSIVRKLRRVLCIWQVKSPFTIMDRLSYSGWAEPPVDEFDYLTSALWVRETITYVNVVNHGLQRALQALKTKHNPLHRRLDLAISILDHATKRQRHDSESAEEIMWLAKIDWLQEETENMEAFNIGAEYMLVNAITKSATPKGMRTWVHFHKKVPIDTRLQLHKDAMTPGSWLNQVAEVFVIKRELDFQLKCVLLDAMPSSWVDALWQKRNAQGDISTDAVMKYTAKWLKKLRGFNWWTRDAYRRGEIGYGELLPHPKGGRVGVGIDSVQLNDEDLLLDERDYEVRKPARLELQFPRLPEPMTAEEEDDENEQATFDRRMTESAEEALREMHFERERDLERLREKRKARKERKKLERASAEVESTKVLDPTEFAAQMAAFAATNEDDDGRR